MPLFIYRHAWALYKSTNEEVLLVFHILERQVPDSDARLLKFNFFSCDLAEVHHRCLGNHLDPCHCSNMGK